MAYMSSYIPVWAVKFITEGDAEGLTRAQQKTVSDWMDANYFDMCSLNLDERGEIVPVFTDSPIFGAPGLAVRAMFIAD